LTPSSAAEIDELLRAIELIVLDVDGVLTDGAIIVDDNGVESKHFHVRDGSGISLWRKSGKRVAILSGRKAACVDLRGKELGISPILQGEPRKLAPFLKLLDELNLQPRQVCFMGDDLPDVPVLRVAGLAACPADAAAEVRAVAHVVTDARGGQGAVRELIERLLKQQGLWEKTLERTYALSVPD
jgi:3-deoxy-D-manno-octulosonate 8-phosphate phosphatase (KDO 8-P phosphatase)